MRAFARSRKQDGFIVIGCLVIVAVIGIVVLLIAIFGANNEYDPPNTKYTTTECQAIRFQALDDNNPTRSDAALEYQLYCE